jgi:hypothetical protein
LRASGSKPASRMKVISNRLRIRDSICQRKKTIVADIFKFVIPAFSL